MLSVKEKGIIYNIIKHCKRIEEKIINIDREVFDKSEDIKGMRDWVAHGYGTIDWSDVWNTATKDIAPLRLYCEEILGNCNEI